MYIFICLHTYIYTCVYTVYTYREREMCVYIYNYSFMHICVQVVLNYIDRDVSTKPSTASFQLFAVCIYMYTDIYAHDSHYDS